LQTPPYSEPFAAPTRPRSSTWPHWLVTGQIVPFSPARSVRGPKNVVKKGKTPVLSAEDARFLLDSIPLKIGPELKPGGEDARPTS
jgi:hypothetical protein